MAISLRERSYPSAAEQELASTSPALHVAPWWEIPANEIRRQGQAYQIVKRALDVTLALVLMIPVLLVLLACALSIRLDTPGPIFFNQWRTGKGGRRFRMFKLRTMRQDAEELKLKYAHLNMLKPPDFKIVNDPRITRVGRILRKTSLDELPQIFNVLLGDMSFVGPRPTSFAASTYALWHTERLDVQPGLTGLWQVEGRGETEFDERLRLDIAYVRNRCLWLDVLILFHTISAVAKQKGAQ